ncbi:MAG: 1,4-dihydroxy-6-naphthoate synthase [Deferrisomatales bacterium]|nr:1,4-dihydroxy-6-naphthoate synthase [Deferrisomatales bacterium]
MGRTIGVGYSPCPNDTFLFHALVHGLVDTEGYRFEPVLEDVETLNRWALEARLPLTKASFGVLGQVRRRYWCLRSGGALGWGCGPLLVAREARPLEELVRTPVLVPGLHTTANLLLTLRAGRAVERLPRVFHEVMPAVARGEAASGVIIHEGRFTYHRHGLVAVEDLGAWWERETGLPIPLGGILLRRGEAGVDPAVVQRAVRRSVEHALAHPDAPMPYVRSHAQELEDGVIRDHIRLYVNDFSRDLGERGIRAVEELLQAAAPGDGGEAPETLFPPADP